MKNTGVQMMTEGSLTREIISFALPLILGNLMQQLYNTADSVIVGQLVGSDALAAVGAGTALINLLIAFSQGAAAGAGVVIAQQLGAGSTGGTGKAVHTAFAIALTLGIILSVTGFSMARVMLVWMDTPNEILGDAAAYMRIYFCGVVFNVLYNMAAGVLNAAGNSKQSLFFLSCASLINIALDLVLVGQMGFGVSGAAAATSVSQFISALLIMRFLTHSHESFRVDMTKLTLHSSYTAKIIKIGLPTAIQNAVISFANVLVQSGVNGYGAAAMAGFGAYMKIDGFNILPVMSLSLAVTTVTGQNYGAGNIARVKSGLRITLLLGLIYTAVTGALLLTFSEPVMRLFTGDPAVIEYGTRAMKYFCPFYFMLSTMQILAGTVRGTGKSIPPMVVLLVSLCLFRIVWMRYAAACIGSIDGVYVLYPLSWFIGMTLMGIYVLKARWLNK